MAEGTEPWDKVGVNQQKICSSRNPPDQIFGNNTLSCGNASLVHPLAQPGHVPPIPPRNPQTFISPYNSHYLMQPYNPGFSAMTYYQNIPFGEPGNYSDSSSLFGGFPMQQVEASTRQAFQSVETIVRTFSSISMMMESTLQAVFHTFRAIIGVVDHFSRIQVQMSDVFSAVSVTRLLKWFFRRLKNLLQFLKSGKSHAMNEFIWEESENAVTNMKRSNGSMPKFTSNFPVLLFFAIVLGGPWILWRLVFSLRKPHVSKGDWKNGSGEHYKGVAEYDFTAQRNDEMSVSKGMNLFIAPKDQQPPIRGWALVSAGNGRVGLVPQSYIKVLGHVTRVLDDHSSKSRPGASYQQNKTKADVCS